MSALEIIQASRKRASDARYERARKHIVKASETLHRMNCRTHLGKGYRLGEILRDNVSNPFDSIRAAM